MDTKKALLYVSASAALGLGILLGHLNQQLDGERARAESETKKRLEVERRILDLEQNRPATTRARPQALEARRRPARTASPSSADVKAMPAQPAKAQPREGVRAFRAMLSYDKAEQDKLLADPETHELMFTARRTEVAARNPDLVRELDLSADEHEKLLDLLAAHALQQTEIVVDDGSIKPNQPVVDAQRREIAALLGQEKAQRYQAYADAAMLRGHVRAFDALLVGPDTLSAGQAATLVATLQSVRQRFMEELSAEVRQAGQTPVSLRWYGMDFVSANLGGAAVEQRILEQMQRYQGGLRRGAASVLTVAQMRRYQQFLDDELTTQKLVVRSRAMRLDETGGQQ